MARTVRMLLALALAFAAPALARSPPDTENVERILRFTSDVTVERDGDLDVTETIRLVSRGEEIRRGIQRDFPTSYRTALGVSHTTFDVIAVARDGRPEPYELIGLGNGTRVRIGRADTLLPPGEHVYAIHYRTSRQIAYGADTDELYWNATGTGWTFPIDVAEARIVLPAPVRFGERAVYTGPRGATAHDGAVVAEGPGSILFRTTRSLPRENGLTVAASFPASALTPPSAGRRLAWWLRDWATLAMAVGALALLIGYYVRAWWLVGRNPRAGTIVPLFVPPDGLSAAAARYVWKMASDNRGFTAAIVDLAVAGHLHISKDAGGWLHRGTTTVQKVTGGKPLPPAEAAMLDALFADGDTVILKQDSHVRLKAARDALGGGLEGAYCGTLFDKHREWASFGMLMIVSAMLALALLAALVRLPAAQAAEFKTPLLAMAMFGFAWWLGRRSAAAAEGGGLWKLAAFAAFAVGVFSGFPAVIGALENGAWAVLLPLLALPVALSAYSWLYAPTRDGRIVMDHIAGFRRYLGITEEHRLDTLHPPDKTPELFERYLPYAIALDVENHWAERFAGVLASAAATGTATHGLAWYSGSGNVWDDPGGFADSMGSSLASTISSASQAPGGGSSGGGSSGGGGGGGGGSGW